MIVTILTNSWNGRTGVKRKPLEQILKEGYSGVGRVADNKYRILGNNMIHTTDGRSDTDYEFESNEDLKEFIRIIQQEEKTESYTESRINMFKKELIEYIEEYKESEYGFKFDSFIQWIEDYKD